MSPPRQDCQSGFYITLRSTVAEVQKEDNKGHEESMIVFQALDDELEGDEVTLRKLDDSFDNHTFMVTESVAVQE